MTEDDTVWLDSCDFNKDTYRIESIHCQTGKGGVLALIHRSTNEVKLVAKGQTRFFEYATCSLRMRRKTITITGIYHPPPKDKITNGMFIDNITNHITSSSPPTINNIILGDFNMQINDMSSNDGVIFKDTLTALGLTKHVTTSTHAKGNILNLIFTEEATSIKLTSCQVGPFLSDHKLLSAVLNIKKPPIEKKTLSVCELNCITEESFKASFNEDVIDLTSLVNTVSHQLSDELPKALDTIAPLKESQVATHQRQPWFDKVVKARHKVV